MKTTPHRAPRRDRFSAATLGLALLALASASAAAGKEPLSFAAPDEAVTILVAAVKAGDTIAMMAILGSDAGPLVDSGDPVADRTAWDKFVAAYEEAHVLEKTGDDHVTLETGATRWPFPIPLVRADGRWHFDTEAGEQEIIARRVGRNELSTIQACLAFVDAQHEYFARNPLGGQVAQYAQHVASTPGKRDGLYWETAEGEAPSPLGPLIVSARGEGYRKAGTDAGVPYHGYLFRMLTKQGKDAAGGAYDYIVRGTMIGGFALVAYPAEYDSSGVMTFVVNHDGVVFEKDLGPATTKTVAAMTAFNPDATWKRIEPESDAAAASAPQ
ncbi:MAG: DUF2950 domain-containing protein [Candidatus Binatia bacterium]